MKVVKPVAMLDAVVISSTATETYAAYSAATTYALGNKATSGNSVYECIQAPSLNKVVTDALWWKVASPTNRWAMFDAEISTQTVQASSISVTLAPGYINSLTLFNLEGNTLQIDVTDGPGGPNVYSETINLDRVYDWYAYFFSTVEAAFDVALTDLPPYSNARVIVSLSTGAATPVKIGQMSVGTFVDLGGVHPGATAGIISFSKKETNLVTGVTTLKKGKNSKRMSLRLQLDTAQMSKVQRALADLDGVACAWIGVDDVDTYGALLMWGFWRDFSIEVAYPTISYCSLEVEGLI